MLDVGSRRSTISLSGHFNPLILQPDWLLANGLIDAAGRSEALESDAQVLTADFVRGEYPSFRFDAFRDSFTVASVDATRSPVVLRDFAEGVARLLPHTPIQRVEIAHIAELRGDAAPVLERFANPAAWSDVAALSGPEVSTVTFEASVVDSPGLAAEVTVETAASADHDLLLVVALGIEADGDPSGRWASEQLAAHWQTADDVAGRILQAVAQ